MTDKKEVNSLKIVLVGLIGICVFAFFCYMVALVQFIPFLVFAIFRVVCCYKFPQKNIVIILFSINVVASIILCFYDGPMYEMLIYTMLSVLIVIGQLKENKQLNIIVAMLMVLSTIVILILLVFKKSSIGFCLFVPIYILLDLTVLFKFGLNEFVNIDTIKSIRKSVVTKKMLFTECTLEDLKEAYEKGEISEEEYDRRKTEIINSL